MMRYLILTSLIFLTSCTSGHKSETATLANRSPIRVSVDKTLPRQYVSIVFEGMPEKVDGEDQALFPLMSTILSKGPKGMTEKEYRRFLFLKNADIHYGARYRAFTLSLVAPPQYISQVMGLAIDTLRNPKLDKKNINESLESLKANVASSFSRMSTAIQYYAFKEFFDFASFTHNGSASPKRVSGLKWQEVAKKYEKYFSFENLRYYASGPLSLNDIKSLIASNKNLDAFHYQEYNFAKQQMPKEKKKIVIVHRPKVTDYQVILVSPFSVQRDKPEAAISDIVFEIFGGGLTGRLGTILREKKGLTYHVSAHYGQNLPVWYIYSFAGSQQIKDLLKGMFAVKTDMAGRNITANELSLAKRGLVTAFREANELPSDRLVREMQFDLYDLNTSFLNQYESYVNNVSLKEVNDFSNSIFSKNHYSLYLMGDKNVLVPVVKSLSILKGYEIKIVEEDNI